MQNVLWEEKMLRPEDYLAIKAFHVLLNIFFWNAGIWNLYYTSAVLFRQRPRLGNGERIKIEIDNLYRTRRCVEPNRDECEEDGEFVFSGLFAQGYTLYFYPEGGADDVYIFPIAWAPYIYHANSETETFEHCFRLAASKFCCRRDIYLKDQLKIVTYGSCDFDDLNYILYPDIFHHGFSTVCANNDLPLHTFYRGISKMSYVAQLRKILAENNMLPEESYFFTMSLSYGFYQVFKHIITCNKGCSKYLKQYLRFIRYYKTMVFKKNENYERVMIAYFTQKKNRFFVNDIFLLNEKEIACPVLVENIGRDQMGSFPFDAYYLRFSGIMDTLDARKQCWEQIEYWPAILRRTVKYNFKRLSFFSSEIRMQNNIQKIRPRHISTRIRYKKNQAKIVNFITYKEV